MRILVAHNVPRSRTGGMSRMMGFIHDRLGEAGHVVEEFTADDAPGYAHGRWGRFGFPWAVYRHAREAHRLGRGYDLINVHEPSAAVVVARKNRLGRPIVAVTSHGVEQRGWEVALEDRGPGRSAPSWRSRWAYPATSLWQSRFGLRRADHVFCLNDEDRDYIVRRFGRRPEDVTRIYPAADPTYLDAFAGRDYAASDNLIFFGTWLARKGTPDLVAAFGRLAARRPGLTLTVLGSGFAPAKVLGSFPEHLRGRVECVPPSPAGEYARRMLWAGAIAIPSLFEGTPQTMMEAMATGLPAVATATCGMKDVIEDGTNGLLVPVRDPDALADALDRMLNDRELRERLGRRAHADVAAKYTWDAVAVPVGEAYRRLDRLRDGL